jgi:hypothetical protein
MVIFKAPEDAVPFSTEPGELNGSSRQQGIFYRREGYISIKGGYK